MSLLAVRDARVRFGGILALDDVSFDVEEHTIAGLIGPNGAGKTTTFNVITRLYPLAHGDVTFDGKSLLRTHPSRVIKRGIARTFQNVELFQTMTVLENVLERERVEPRDHVERGRLARAVRPDQPGDRVFLDVEGHVVERQDPAEADTCVADGEEAHDRVSMIWVQRAAAIAVPSPSYRSAPQKTTRRVRCSTRPSARSSPGRAER